MQTLSTRHFVYTLGLVLSLSVLVSLLVLVSLKRLEANVLISGLVFGLLVLLLYAWCVRMFEERIPSELELKLTKTFVSICVAVSLLQAALFVIAVWATGYAPASLQIDLGFEKGEAQVVMLVLVSALFVAPIVEEIVFRGLVFRFLWTRVGHAMALVVQALLFAAVHSFTMSEEWISRFMQLFMSGLLLGLVFAQTRNLWSCVLLHSLLNLTSLSGGLFVPETTIGNAGATAIYTSEVTSYLRKLEIVGVAFLCLLVGYKGVVDSRGGTQDLAQQTR